MTETRAIHVSNTLRANSEAALVRILPPCPICGNRLTTETEIVKLGALFGLTFGGKVGHIDAACLPCHIGVSVKGCADFNAKVAHKVHTAPAAKVAYDLAKASFGHNRLYLFYGNTESNIFLKYADHVTAVKVSKRNHYGKVQTRVTLTFEW